MTSNEIIQKLKSLSNPKNIEGMKRFAVGGKNTLGIPVPDLRKLAKEIKRSHSEQSKKPRDSSVTLQNDRHKLAQELWKSGIHEARILAGMIDEPKMVTEKQMDDWAADFDSWDVCDQVCMNLFDKTKFAYEKAIEWSRRDPEFEKRAGFALMSCLAWHDKNAPDKKLVQFFPIIIRESSDGRNFVKKAINWALRQIGKKNENLRIEALKTANKILNKYSSSKSARWVANDTIRELKNRSLQKP